MKTMHSLCALSYMSPRVEYSYKFTENDIPKQSPGLKPYSGFPDFALNCSWMSFMKKGILNEERSIQDVKGTTEGQIYDEDTKTSNQALQDSNAVSTRAHGYWWPYRSEVLTCFNADL